MKQHRRKPCVLDLYVNDAVLFRFSRSYIRFLGQLTSAMSGLGWMPQRQVTFYYRNFRGFYFLPLSYGILFSSGG